MSIKSPMKAPSKVLEDSQLSALHYPVVGSPKLDGFRCVVDGEPKTSSMKSWPNPYIKDYLSRSQFHGLDGEILVGPPNSIDAFHNTSGPVRRHYGEPDFKFYVFDDWTKGDEAYQVRWLDNYSIPTDDRIVLLPQRILRTPEEVIAFDNSMLEIGYEGAMIRSLTGIYKDKRCSLNEQIILKRKPFVECEAQVIKVLEGKQNNNEPKMNETGQMRRGYSAANMIPNGTFGSFVLSAKSWKDTFRSGLGLGYIKEDAQEIWNNREDYIGRIVTVKYQKYGSRDAPRIPSVIKIRPKWDLE